jgi:hypothetical protein
MMARHRAFGLLLQGDVEEPLCLLKLLIILGSSMCQDVAEMLGGGPVVRHPREAQQIKSPCAVITPFPLSSLAQHGWHRGQPARPRGTQPSP